ncbi:unnamed protein product [Calypogeia fissa]
MNLLFVVGPWGEKAHVAHVDRKQTIARPLHLEALPPFTDVQHTIVKPLEKTAHLETIYPAPSDTFIPEFYHPVLFAYRLQDSSDALYSQAVDRIKASLSKVLVTFFSFAGRWVAVAAGSPRRKLLCNDEGVPFIEAKMGDTDLDAIVKASTAFQPVPELLGHRFLGRTIFTQQLPEDGSGLPPIFVQVTRFGCGGLTMGVTFNPMHVDGDAFFKFMKKSWSQYVESC